MQGIDRVLSAFQCGKNISLDKNSSTEIVVKVTSHHPGPLLTENTLIALARLLESTSGLPARVLGGGSGCFQIEFGLDASQLPLEDIKARLQSIEKALRSKDTIQEIKNLGFDHIYESLAELGSLVSGSSVLEKKRIDSVILTAIGSLEKRAVESVLQQRGYEYVRSDPYGPYQLSIYSEPQNENLTGRSLGLACISGMGNVRSAVCASTLLSTFDIGLLAMVGIAGGIDDVGLGDIVIADHVFYYDSRGKVTDAEWKVAPVGMLTSRKSFNAAALLAAEWGGRDQIDGGDGVATGARCQVVCGDVASGESVIDSALFKEQLKDMNRKIVAVEMEAAGVLYACADYPGVESAVIRGISDMAAQKASTDGTTNFRKVAAINAADFAVDLFGRHV